MKAKPTLAVFMLVGASAAAALPPPVAVAPVVIAEDPATAEALRAMIADMSRQGHFAATAPEATPPPRNCAEVGDVMRATCYATAARATGNRNLVFVFAAPESGTLRVECIGPDQNRAQRAEVTLAVATGTDAAAARPQRQALASCLIGALHSPPAPHPPAQSAPASAPPAALAEQPEGCPALASLPSGAPAEATVREAAQAMAAGDVARAELLARRALGGEGGDVARAWAARLLVDLGLRRGDVGEAEAILACASLRGEAWTHARAWLAYRQGAFAEAVRLLQPLTRPRHHTLPRWSIVHEDLGDSFARLGREADAQAQWRIALATDFDPGATGWDRAALERKLARAAGRPAGAPPMLPLQYYADAVSILDVGSVERTEAGVRYSKLVLLENDRNGVAYGIDSREVRCDAPESRVLSVHSFGAAGAPVRAVETPTSWRRDLPGEPWLGTERALICALAPGMNLSPRRRSDAELLSAYRAGNVLFD